MTFEQLPLPGAFLITPFRLEDPRGFFARTYCEHEFHAHGLCSRFVQCNVSFNRSRGTLRGMHFQREPNPEPKLVRCTNGGIYDVIVDLRRDSPTWRQWWGTELTAENRLALYVPPGCAHGFQTLADNTECFYQMAEFYVPNLSGGVRWNDPAFAIRWPIDDPILSDKDRNYPDYVWL
jgi:dTDP-4-dehydrorhamnose 3,5-epimerase